MLRWSATTSLEPGLTTHFGLLIQVMQVTFVVYGVVRGRGGEVILTARWETGQNTSSKLIGEHLLYIKVND